MADVTRVLLADDQILYRESLRELINRWDGFEVIGEVSNGLEAVEFCRKTVPDLVLMDVQMPVMDGVKATKTICQLCPECSVVMLTVSADEENLFGAIRNGAKGYILKDMPARQLKDRMLGVLRGEAVLSGEVTVKVFKEFNRYIPIENDREEDVGLSDSLSDREIEIIRLVAKGMSNEEIGAQMYLSAGTVKKQLSIIMQKLFLENRIQVAVYASKHGLID